MLLITCTVLSHSAWLRRVGGDSSVTCPSFEYSRISAHERSDPKGVQPGGGVGALMGHGQVDIAPAGTNDHGSTGPLADGRHPYRQGGVTDLAIRITDRMTGRIDGLGIGNRPRIGDRT